MASRRVSANTQRALRSSPSYRIEKQTSRIRKAETRETRKSTRLKAVSQLEYDGEAEPRGVRRSARLKAISHPENDSKRESHQSPGRSLKRKRDQEVLHPVVPVQVPSSKKPEIPLSKKPRWKLVQNAAKSQLEETEPAFVAGGVDALNSWVRDKQWPREYFEPDEYTKEDLLERDSWVDDMMAQPPIPVVKYMEIDGFRYPMPIRKTPTLRRKQSDSSLGESGDERKRETKSTPYRDKRYTTMLEIKGSFMRDFKHQVSQTITDTCRQLLNKEQTLPQNTLFQDHLFDRLCWKLQERNEAMVIQDITRLIVPSAMNLAIYGDAQLDILNESVDETWTGSIAVEGPKPRPDYAVGFERSAFTAEQLEKLSPLVGSVFDTSFFVATYRMYFPFLTCEVKCGAAALDVADRQNAHSMTIAVRSVVELYRAVKREKELDQVILAFSISHDHRSVRIYGHYPVIDGDKVTFYRHPIHEFSFVTQNGREKWTTYKFTKSIYNIWMPDHLRRICSAIDQLPSGISFQVPEETRSEAAAGLIQDTETLHLVSGPPDVLNSAVPQTATPDPSVAKGTGQGPAKRTRKPRGT